MRTFVSAALLGLAIAVQLNRKDDNDSEVSKPAPCWDPTDMMDSEVNRGLSDKDDLNGTARSDKPSLGLA